MKALALLLAIPATIWCTGNLVLALVVAPAAFQAAPPRGDLISREAAGAIFGVVLERWTDLPVAVLLTPILFALGMLVGRAWSARKWFLAGVLLLGLGLTWGAHSVARQTITEVAALAETRRQQTERTPESEAIFAVRHRASERWVVIETVAALLLAVGGTVAALRARPASAPVPGA